jgi:hypothetical protein
LPCLLGSVGGILPAPLGVEAAQSILQDVELLVVHVVVQEGFFVLQLARDLDAGAVGEGHVEKGIEGLAVLGAHLQRGGDEVPCAGVANSEEVPDWDQHARLLLAIPEHLEDEPAQEVRFRGTR